MQCDIHQLGRLLREDNHNLQGTATNNLGRCFQSSRSVMNTRIGKAQELERDLGLVKCPTYYAFPNYNKSRIKFFYEFFFL